MHIRSIPNNSRPGIPRTYSQADRIHSVIELSIEAVEEGRTNLVLTFASNHSNHALGCGPVPLLPPSIAFGGDLVCHISDCYRQVIHLIIVAATVRIRVALIILFVAGESRALEFLPQQDPGSTVTRH